jgi:putative ABC transport system permease protein
VKYLMLIQAGLWRRPTRTVLTAVSLALAFMLFGVMQGVNQGLDQMMSGLQGRVLVANRSMANGLPMAYLEQIRSLPGVRAVAHITFLAGYFQDRRKQIPAFATDVEQMFKVYSSLEIPSEQVAALVRSRTGAVISESLAKEHGWKIGDRILLGSSVWFKKDGTNTFPLDIVGIYKSTDGSEQGLAGAVYFNYSYFDEARSFGGGRIHYFVVSLDDPRSEAAISDSIDAMFANSGDRTESQSEEAFVRNQIKRIADIDFIVNSVVGAVLFSLVFLTINTMMHSVRERRAEFATLKALGFRDGVLTKMVISESLLLCIGAAVFGLVAARIAFPYVGKNFGANRMPVEVIVVALAIALVLAAVSALPSARAMRKWTVADLMRMRVV